MSKPPKDLSELIDRLERLREELQIIQTALEKFEGGKLPLAGRPKVHSSVRR